MRLRGLFLCDFYFVLLFWVVKMEGFCSSRAKKRKKQPCKDQEIVDAAISKIFIPQTANEKKNIRENEMKNE